MDLTNESIYKECERCVEFALEDYPDQLSNLEERSLVFSTAAAFCAGVQGACEDSLQEFYPSNLDYEGDKLISNVIDCMVDIIAKFRLTEQEINLK